MNAMSSNQKMHDLVKHRFDCVVKIEKPNMENFEGLHFVY